MARIIIWSSLVLLPLIGLAQWSQPGDRYYYSLGNTTITVSEDDIFDAGPNQDIVIECDLNLNSASITQMVVTKRNSGFGAGNPGYGLFINASGRAQSFFDWTGSSSAISAIGTSNLVGAGWKKIKSVFDRDGNVSIWVDGVSEASTSISAHAAQDLSNSQDLTIGNDFNGGTGPFPVDGDIDNVKIWIDGKMVAWYRFDEAQDTIRNRLGGNDAVITTAGTGAWVSKATPPPPPFSPTDVSGLVAWLEAEDPDGDGNSGNNSGDYSTWVDKSGNGNDFSALAGDEPTYIANHLNGHAALDFDGSNDAMSSGAISALNSVNDYAVYVVAESDATSGGFKYMFNGAFNSIGSSVYGFYTSSPTEITGIRRNSAFGAVTSTLSVTYTDPYIAAFYWEDNSSYLRVNGTSSSTGSGTDYTITSHDNFWVGGAALGSALFDGKICEVILYQGVLSAGDKTDIENYLTTKYGL